MTFNNFPTVRRPNSFTIEEASFYAGFFRQVSKRGCKPLLNGDPPDNRARLERFPAHGSLRFCLRDMHWNSALRK